MKEWLKKKWAAYYKPMYRVAIFIVAAVLMVLSFPNADKMQYEYELQRPWRYDNIIAPFDFPIYKTDHEVTVERDSILNNFRPYYKRDSIGMAEVEKLVNKLLNQNANKLSMICPQSVNTDTVRNFMSRELTTLLSKTYKKGVLELPEQVDASKDYEMMVIDGNVLEPYSLSELMTMGEAYKEMIGSLEKKFEKKFGAAATWTGVLVDRLPLSDLINANITFDSERTEIEKNSRLANMSLTSGKVLAGQKIISTGDIVDNRSVRLIESLKKAMETQYGLVDRSEPVYAGQFIIILTLLATVYLFLRFFRKDVFEKLSNLNFIVLMMTIFVVGAGFVSQRHGNISFVLPFVVSPIVMRIFLDSRLAMYVHTVTILIISFLAYNSQLFIILHIPAGMVAIISLFNLSSRGQMVRTSIVVFVTYALIYTGYIIWETGEYANINPYVMLMFAVNGLLMLLSYPLIYIYEKMFGFISEVTLMELSDSNTALLRQLSEKAPGTFQHSMQVGNLGQEVAIRIGANGMMVRAGAMYHDLGKIVTPGYFTENQAGGENPHDGMECTESAQMIIKHIENGVKLAKKHGIPKQIIDIIKTHHGKSTALYFYRTWCNHHPGEEPDIEKFSYPGPMPTTKEQAIVMMADAVEASSKSLKEYTDKTIDELVEKIINSQMDQFKHAPITFRDIEIAKEVFKEKLKNIYHGRIQYPELLK
ncbi:MAG: HDIG domain-containing protein [Bacteroidales bacterium]|nr:HDIG domain-containing protein [Bacteroidales bacterium]